MGVQVSLQASAFNSFEYIKARGSFCLEEELRGKPACMCNASTLSYRSQGWICSLLGKTFYCQHKPGPLPLQSYLWPFGLLYLGNQKRFSITYCQSDPVSPTPEFLFIVFLFAELTAALAFLCSHSLREHSGACHTHFRVEETEALSQGKACTLYSLFWLSIKCPLYARYQGYSSEQNRQKPLPSWSWHPLGSQTVTT